MFIDGFSCRAKGCPTWFEITNGEEVTTGDLTDIDTCEPGCDPCHSDLKTRFYGKLLQPAAPGPVLRRADWSNVRMGLRRQGYPGL